MGTLASEPLPARPTYHSAPALQPLQVELAAEQRPLPLREESLQVTPKSLLSLVYMQRRRHKDTSRTECSKVPVLLSLTVCAWPPGADGLHRYRLLLLDAVAAFRAFGPRLQGDRKLKTAQC